MEKLFEAVVTIAVFAVAVPLLIFLAVGTIKITGLAWVIGEKLELLAREKIDKQFSAKHERRRKEINDD